MYIRTPLGDFSIIFSVKRYPRPSKQWGCPNCNKRYRRLTGDGCCVNCGHGLYRGQLLAQKFWELHG